jgi:hypothetical protein
MKFSGPSGGQHMLILRAAPSPSIGSRSRRMGEIS